jgi:hypothetical protein
VRHFDGLWMLQDENPQPAMRKRHQRESIGNFKLPFESLNNNRQGSVAVLPLRFSELDPGNLRGVEMSGSVNEFLLRRRIFSTRYEHYFESQARGPLRCVNSTSSTPNNYKEAVTTVERCAIGCTRINRDVLMFFTGQDIVHACYVRYVTNRGAGLGLNGRNTVPFEVGILFDAPVSPDLARWRFCRRSVRKLSFSERQ